MKFKKEDMLLYLPTSGPSMHGDSVMYVIDYDEKQRKSYPRGSLFHLAKCRMPAGSG